MSYQLRKANQDDISKIWDILQSAIDKRKSEGSLQWQDGYPNPQIIQLDIDKEVGFVLTKDKEIIGYCSLFINDEPVYNHIKGEWLSEGDFVAFHRLAIKTSHIGKGFATDILTFIEGYALENNIYSVKADTNFDNPAMLHLFDKMGYTYCGEVNIKNRPRKAFEKVLNLNHRSVKTTQK